MLTLLSHGNKRFVLSLTSLFIGFLVMGIVSAGIGIKWGQETILVVQGERACISYSVYNPWPQDSYAKVGVSDELKSILESQESETKLISANTKSSEALPVMFCFEVPLVYQSERDCLIGGMLCKQSCPAELKSYKGEILVSETVNPAASGGSGGSATSAVVSAPLTVRVACNQRGRDYQLVYLSIIIILIAILAYYLMRRYRKPEEERYEEKIKKLELKLKSARTKK